MTSSTHLVIVSWLFFLISYIDCIGEADVRVLKDERVFNPDGSYFYNVILSNGQEIYEVGYLKRNEATGEEFLVKEGYSTYIGPDGKNYTVKYVADENGYVGEGEHIYKVPTQVKTTQRPTATFLPSSTHKPPPPPPSTHKPPPPPSQISSTTRPTQPPIYITTRKSPPAVASGISDAERSNLGCDSCDIAGTDDQPRRRRKIQLLMEMFKKLSYF